MYCRVPRVIENLARSGTNHARSRGRHFSHPRLHVICPSITDSYLTQILRAARGAGLDPQQAEDVTQATFTTFIEAAPRFEGRSSVRTWLFGILYKKIAEARRARQRDRQMDEIDEAFEHRFDASGNWSTPPQPIDTDLHHEGGRN